MFPSFFEPYPAPTNPSILTGVLRMSHKYEYEALDTKPRPPWFAELVGPHFPVVTVLACELSIDWILPVAFYRVCEFTVGRTILDSPHSLDDKACLMTACRVLESAAVTKILEFLWSTPPPDECDTPADCYALMVQCRRDAEGWRDRLPTSAAMMPLDVWEAGDWNRLDVCVQCMASMTAAHRQAKQAIWDQLPELFELPEWSELEKIKAEALE
ncbi:BTB domain-containing protein [Mycena venus]|uniref:BTB domain-containing protein n=1 Tax=Mycena venus TaxID=2733690 RepID=A0A8H7D8H4_9AGAR|nr:BTB domain-containing protein [Mycena venus]